MRLRTSRCTGAGSRRPTAARPQRGGPLISRPVLWPTKTLNTKSWEKLTMKEISIGGIPFSKVVCGTNAFYGRSHFSKARDIEYSTRCDDEYIKRVLVRCMDFGVNAIESSANERIQQIIADLRARYQTPLYSIGNTRIDATSPMRSHQEKLKFLKILRQLKNSEKKVIRN